MTQPQHSAEPDPAPLVRPRRLERLVVIDSVIIVLLVAAVSIGSIWLGSLTREVGVQRDGKKANAQALGTANSSLSKAGLPPVPTPSAVGPAPTVTRTVTQTGAPGPSGVDGSSPSAAQIQVAVAAYCTVAHCGGYGPTRAQVAQAVASYCDSNGKCRGAAGTSGASGPAGAAGASGQNATSDQVAAAVATYCAAHNQCAGPAGPTGSPGPSGASGADGTDGTNGSNGAPGQPPYSWTYTTTGALGGTTTHTCSRADPFDPAAPTYTCS